MIYLELFGGLFNQVFIPLLNHRTIASTPRTQQLNINEQ
jgi:hypothetical protein